MTERFTRVFTLPEELYTPGSPLLIQAGALLKDRETGRVIAQLKLKNISTETAQAVRVRIWPVDAMGRAAPRPLESMYLDLAAPRGREFGTKVPIPMPDPTTRSFRAEIVEAAFSGGVLWTASEGAVWAPLPAPQPLETALGDPGLAEQLRLERGEDCRFAPAELTEDLWRCPCGEAVRAGLLCPKCLRDYEPVDPSALKLARNERLAAERRAQEEARAEAERKAAEERAAAEERQAAERAAAEQRAKKRKKILKIALPALAALALLFVAIRVAVPAARYSRARSLLDNGQYEEAAAAFEALGDYRDSADCAIAAEARAEAARQAAEEQAQQEALGAAEAEETTEEPEELAEPEEPQVSGPYAEAEALLAEGKLYDAAVAFYALGDEGDARQRCFAIWDQLAERQTVADKGDFIVGLRTDGTVVAAGYDRYGQLDVDDWTDIVAVAASDYITVGLRADGRVVAVGATENGRGDVDDWTDIVAISAQNEHTVGLRADGTVVATGTNISGCCEVDDWTGVVAISTGRYYTVGLRADGTVLTAGLASLSSRRTISFDVDDWTDVVAVSVGSGHVVGLRADGTVLAAGDDRYGQCNVADWTDIVHIDARYSTTRGLRADGTVVTTNGSDDWTDIVAISSGYGIRADGTVAVAAGEDYLRRAVADWTDIVAVYGSYHLVGLRADGTLVATWASQYSYNRRDGFDPNAVNGWTDIKLPSNAAPITP